MYKALNISLLYKNKVTESFYTTIGLKQGGILSTIFFNLFINDLPLLLADTSNGDIQKPKLEDTNINSLLFADDLAIFSVSQKELQNKINTLEEYCYNWGLELTIQNTKIIIFNKHGANIKKFKFYRIDKEIEIAKQYTYLGFTFTPTGKKQVGIDNLINKARKVWFSIQKCYINETKKPSTFI